MKQTPLAIEEEPQESPVAGDAWALDVDCRDHTVTARDSLRASLAAKTEAFLHKGGKVTVVPPGQSAMRLECTTVHYVTRQDGDVKHIPHTAFTDKNMTRREIDKRSYAHLRGQVSQLARIGFNAEHIANVCGVSVGQVERVLKDLGEGKTA